MKRLTFQEYVAQSDFEDWIYDNFTGDFKIDFDSEIEWISETSFTRKVKDKKKTVPESIDLKCFDPYQYEHCGGKVTIAVDKKGLITVTGTKYITVHEQFVARVYVNRMVGRGINGVTGVYYDVPVDNPEEFYESLKTNKFVTFTDIIDTYIDKEYDAMHVTVNTDSITDIQVFPYTIYEDEVNTH